MNPAVIKTGGYCAQIPLTSILSPKRRGRGDFPPPLPYKGDVASGVPSRSLETLPSPLPHKAKGNVLTVFPVLTLLTVLTLCNRIQ